MTKLYHTCDDCKDISWLKYGESGNNRWVENKEIVCPRCETAMNKFTACHMICPNCGAHLDCSDKGSYW